MLRGSEAELDVLLAELGFEDALAQTDSLIEQALLREAESLSNAQHQQLSSQLLTHCGGDVLQSSLRQSLAQRSPPGLLAEAASLLQTPLIARVRNFEVLLEMPGAAEKFYRFHQNFNDDDIGELRGKLVTRLDMAMAASELAALQQTELELAVELLLARHRGKPLQFVDRQRQLQKQRQRQQHLAAVNRSLYYYSYRLLPDSELQLYVMTMESAPLQQYRHWAVEALQLRLQQCQRSLSAR